MPAAENEILRNYFNNSKVLLRNTKDLKIRELYHMNVRKIYCFKYANFPQIDAMQPQSQSQFGRKTII